MATKHRTTKKSASTRAGVRPTLPKLPRKPAGALKADVQDDLVAMGLPVGKVRDLLRHQQQAGSSNRNQAGQSTSQRKAHQSSCQLEPSFGASVLNCPQHRSSRDISPSLRSILLEGVSAHDENGGLIVKVDKGKGRAAESDSDPEEMGTPPDQTSAPSLSSQGDDENADLSDPPTRTIGVKRFREDFEESAIRSSLVDEGHSRKKARSGAR
ncbi:hypothetical protein C8Q74DRAFT_1222069 [Fomes fomentarius]|nr:hypothetical protein C8Q74DRAFT_1222069 [Fomes fomentarius]